MWGMILNMQQLPYNPQNATLFEFFSREFSPEDGVFSFVYKIHFDNVPALEFKETIQISSPERVTTLSPDFFSAILEDLHLVLGISYYKLFCPPVMKFDIPLSSKQAVFWNTLYTKGLGEFLYRNNLSFTTVAQFKSSESSIRFPKPVATQSKKVLVGIGGGKDSIVALELLKEYDRTGFVKETSKENTISRNVADKAGVPLVIMTRHLDPQVLQGVPGSYNGHVPISSVYAFLGVLEAALGKHQSFIVANEHSSNFGNLMHEGNDINHKWSGSSEFEILFQDYVRAFLTPDIRYFSLTRPFYEFRVVKIFTELGRKYFDVFSSCNRNFAHSYESEKLWCGECPKCAFGFLMLAAFLDEEDVVGIFKKNLFEDVALVPLFRDLLGFGTLKPFDCVGTFDESRVAMTLVGQRWKPSVVSRELVPLVSEVALSDEVLKVQQALTVPSEFRMLGMESVLILGYGKEGKTSEAYLKEKYPRLRIGIKDQTDGANYLDEQHNFDIVIKTPGIHTGKITRQYTTATNFFFNEVGAKNIIGITGSKGKSTTATLLYEIIRASGKKAELVGNIGNPALQTVLESTNRNDTLYIMELSSYQLEDLDMSPHIAILTSLFPEHLDHHGSLATYYKAKSAIVRFQTHKDIALCAEGFHLLSEWVDSSPAQTVALKKPPFMITNHALAGEHMYSNVILAYTVAHMLGVDDSVAEKTIAAFSGLPHRLMLVGTYKGITFYDDSISTTPESTIAGIRALENVHTIILGGEDRGLDFTLLEEELYSKGVKVLILFPETGNRMIQKEDGFTVLHTENMEQAVEFAYKHTPEKSIVLLSPASPSYNLFKNFEDRGSQFIEAVKKYGI